MISMTQLKLSSIQEDSYNKIKSNHFDTVEIKDNISQWRSYVMKRIIDKRMRTYENIKVVQYLIR